MVWNFTNDARLATHYAVAEFVVEPREGGSTLRWTYRFSSSSWITRGALRSFVEDQYAGLMQVCMDNIQRLALQDFHASTSADPTF